MTEIQRCAGGSVSHTSCALHTHSVNPKQSISSDIEAGGCSHSQHGEITLSPIKNTICHSVWKKGGAFWGTELLK